MSPYDLQVNGYDGADFCSRDLTSEDFHRACVSMQEDGVNQFLATVITDSVSQLCAKLRHLADLREADPLARQMMAGIHIEGPFLNPAPGFIGAHPPESVVEANVDDAKRMIEASQGLTRLVTLAPECDPGHRTTAFLAGQGIVVSAGHCDPSLDELRGAIDAGLTVFTHLGNGCPVTLARHDNIIQRALSCSDRLWVCYIPDGAHVDFFALRNYLKISGIERSIMVTDAIAAAKLGPGRYTFSGFEVEIDPQGIARRPGYQNLAGSTVTMCQIRRNLATHLDLDENEIRSLIDTNPRKAVPVTPQI